MERGDSSDSGDVNELKSLDPKQQQLEKDVNLAPEQLAALQKRYFVSCNLSRLGVALVGTMLGGQLHSSRIIPNAAQHHIEFRPFGVSRFAASMSFAFAALMATDNAISSCRLFRYYVIEIPEWQRRRTVAQQEELLRGYQQRRQAKMDEEAWR